METLLSAITSNKRRNYPNIGQIRITSFAPYPIGAIDFCHCRMVLDKKLLPGNCRSEFTNEYVGMTSAWLRSAHHATTMATP